MNQQITGLSFATNQVIPGVIQIILFIFAFVALRIFINKSKIKNGHLIFIATYLVFYNQILEQLKTFTQGILSFIYQSTSSEANTTTWQNIGTVLQDWNLLYVLSLIILVLIFVFTYPRKQKSYVSDMDLSKYQQVNDEEINVQNNKLEKSSSTENKEEKLGSTEDINEDKEEKLEKATNETLTNNDVFANSPFSNIKNDETSTTSNTQDSKTTEEK